MSLSNSRSRFGLIILRWTGLGLAACVLLLALSYSAMRVSDGPIEFYPWFTISIGGPFRSGEVVESPADWDFLEDQREIALQTLSPNSSRTVWVPVVDGRLYIVSGYMNSSVGRLWKQWPARMAEDNRIRLRVDNKIYEQRLERIAGGPIAAAVMSEIARKYFGAPATVNQAAGAAVSSGSVWLFEVAER